MSEIILTQFYPGTKVKAVEVNGNFTALKTAINETNTLLQAVTEDITDISQISADTTITKQGNTFNNANQLVKLNSSGKLPAVDGSLITNVGTKNITQIGTCTSASGEEIKAVTMNGFTETDGATVKVKFTNKNTANILRMQFNSDPVREVYSASGRQLADGNYSYIPAGATIEFTYNSALDGYVMTNEVVEAHFTSFLEEFSWYKIYSNGLIEQGGKVAASSVTSKWIILTIPHKIADRITYQLTPYLASDTGGIACNLGIAASSTTDFTITTASIANMYIYWETKGY